MTTQQIPILLLDDLKSGFPGLTPEKGATFAQAASVCLEHERHKSGECHLFVKCESSLEYNCKWSEVTEQMRNGFADLQEATEEGASGIAILLIKEITGFGVIRRSYKGTGVDYYIGERIHPNEPFKEMARLEVSGILSGSETIIKTRMKEKMEQTKRSDGFHPAFIVIVEFGMPEAQVRQR